MAVPTFTPIKSANTEPAPFGAVLFAFSGHVPLATGLLVIDHIVNVDGIDTTVVGTPGTPYLRLKSPIPMASYELGRTQAKWNGLQFATINGQVFVTAIQLAADESDNDGTEYVGGSILDVGYTP